MAWVNWAIGIVSFIGLIFLAFIILLASTWNYYRNLNSDGTIRRPSSNAKAWFWVILALVILLTLVAMVMVVVGAIPERNLPLSAKQKDGRPNCPKTRRRAQEAMLTGVAVSPLDYDEENGYSSHEEPKVENRNGRTFLWILSAIVSLMGIGLLIEMRYWYYDAEYYSPGSITNSPSSAFFL